jgi:lysophospholipase L1-like esterase
MSRHKILGLLVAATIIVAILLLIASNRAAAPSPGRGDLTTTPGTLRYLPLGDSYTIGESVAPNQRWPNQVVAKLAADSINLKIITNPAVTGYTSQDLIDQELPLVSSLDPDFVSIQIGVNDYVQKVPIQTFQKNLDHILDVVQKGIPQPSKIVLVTIPDYAKTPTGARYGDPVAATAAITSFNEVITNAAKVRNLPVADVFAVSQGVVGDPSLTARDGLHPSGKQYGLWTSKIYQAIQAAGTFK